MKKIEEPIVKVVKLEAMDVIATSGNQSGVTVENVSTAEANKSKLW